MVPAFGVIPVRNVRAAPVRPLSARQLEIVRMLAEGKRHDAIARKMRCKVATVRWHIQEAAMRVPGDGPASSRLIYWYRGASRELLAGT